MSKGGFEFKDWLVVQDKLTRYCGDSVGKDKILRLAGYVFRLGIGVIDLAPQITTTPEDWQRSLLAAEKSCGSCRRVVRFGKLFTHLNGIFVNAVAKYEKDHNLGAFICEVIRNLILIVYLYYDHIYWFIGVGLIKRLNGQYYSRGAAIFWCLSVFAAIFGDLFKLLGILERQRRAKQQRIVLNREKDANDWLQRATALDAQTKSLAQERSDLYLNLTRSIFDLPLGLTGALKLNSPAWFIGLIGIFTSLIGIRQTWQQKIVAVDAAKKKV